MKLADVLVAFSLILCGCVSWENGRTANSQTESRKTFDLRTASPSPQEADLLEALLRFDLANTFPASNEGYQFDCVFVGWGEADPPEDFLQRFDAQNIKPKSAAHVTTEGVFDKKTGRRGIVASYNSITWLGKEDVQVSGRVFAAGLSAARYEYRLNFTHGRWSVIDKRKVLTS